MGEEEKKPEEKKTEEPKTEEKKTEEPKEQPLQPPEIVLRAYMHCEGCARKVRRCLKGLQGVENVETDCKGHKVVVKGEKADPVAVLERVQKKSHGHVELLSPIPKPPPEDPKKSPEQQAEKPTQKKVEPQVITVVLKVHMHCEACARAIKRGILKMSGVDGAEPDLNNSQVTVKGIFDPPKLVEYVQKRTGKHAIIIKQEPDNKKEEEKGKEEKKADGDKAAAEEKKDGGNDVVAPLPVEGEKEVANVVELKKNEFYYNYFQNYQINPYLQRYEMYPYQQYPHQMFSDENPNACYIM